MIVFDLKCEKGHVFEGWFKDSRTFECQREQRLLECPVCGSHSIEKVLSPVRYNKGYSREKIVKDGPHTNEAMMTVLQTIYEKVKSETEDVGTRFAAEALKIHYGVIEPKGIRGVATEEEEKMLRDEGVNFFKIPVPASKTKKSEDN